MKVLHLVRNLHDWRALITAEEHAGGHEVVIVLLQDAVLDATPFPGTVLACKDDVRARGNPRGREVVDYDDIVDQIFAADRVIAW